MPHSEVTRLLNEARGGRGDAADRVYPLIYDELRRMAGVALRRESAGHTLQATALVHEAYLKLVDQTRVSWNDRAHFFAIAAQAIRRILVDHARAQKRQKRGGEWQRLDFTQLLNLPAAVPAADLLALEAAMQRLGEVDPLKVRVVEMRFYAGLTHDEVAQVMGVTTRTVERYWQFARAWLYRELQGHD